MSNIFHHIGALDSSLHFCEDFTASAAVDSMQAAGKGPLAGRVIGLKSNIRVAGQAWTGGIAGRATYVADTDAPLVATLREAGATILSRLAMDEGALGAATDNPHFGRCENPLYPGHSAGGSSGGAAAAVAAGAVYAAIGSDTMGSARIPAAYCGVYGLKFGDGTLGRDGVLPLAPSLDAIGLLSGTTAALNDVFDVLTQDGAGIRPTTWCALPEAVGNLCRPETRIFHAACHNALSTLLGAPEVLPNIEFAALRRDAFLLTEFEAVASIGNEPGLSQELSRLIDYGRKLTSKKLAPAKARMSAARTLLRESLGATRVLLLPTVAEPAFPQGTRPPAGQADFTTLANIAGLPAIAIPQPGAIPPISVQLIGPEGSERALIEIASSLAACV